MYTTARQWILLLGIGGLIGWFLGSNSCSQRFLETHVKTTNSLSFTKPSLNQAQSPTGPKDVFSDFQMLLADDQYQKALQVYDSARASNNEASSGRYRTLILNHTHHLIRTGQHQRAQRLLRLYLEIDDRDVEGLMMLAQNYHHQKNHEMQIKTLYDARVNAYRTEQLVEIERQIRTAVDSYTKQLTYQDNQQHLLELYQLLITVEPSYSPYFLRLAEIQAALKRYDEAMQSLNVIIYDVNLADKAAKLLHEIEQNRTRVDEIVPLKRRGAHFLIDAQVNATGPVTLLLDTGASLTAIKPSALQKLGITLYDADQIVTLNTANGNVEVPVITLSALALGGQTVEQVKVAVLELDGSPEIDGLLGMNVLKSYEFFIDQDKNLLLLSEKY